MRTIIGNYQVDLWYHSVIRVDDEEEKDMPLRHLLNFKDWSAAEIEGLLDLASQSREIKKNIGKLWITGLWE